jgi:hypothetical protein
MSLARSSIVAVASYAFVGVWLANPVAAASSTVECGQVTAYTAPDAAGPTDGSLTIGTLTPWVIAAGATLSAAVAANLPAAVGTSPVCLDTERDGGGVITGLDFAPEGNVSGPVVFDAAHDGYDFAQRLLIPSFITDTYPGLAAVFPTSADAGTDATVTFFLDVSTGRLTAIDARASFCGRGDLAANGDGIVGEARIPASVLDATDSNRLANAGSRRTCATVRSHGSLDPDTGALSLTTTVTISVEPASKRADVTVTPPPTSTIDEQPRAASGGVAVAPLVVLWLGAFTLVTSARRGRKSH